MSTGLKWDFFISHATEDKEAAARPLAEALKEHGFSIWYDEDMMKLGSLRRQMDEGLATCRYGIVIVSHNFFAKRWPQNELDGLFTQELVRKQEIIIPIWHNISFDEVAKYSPLIAGRNAADMSWGTQSVVQWIVQVVSRLPTLNDIEATPSQVVNDLTHASIKWHLVFDLWWLCHDLMETYRWLLSGVSKEWIDIGLRQSSHHAEQLHLYDDLTSRLRLLKNEAEGFSEQDWTSEKRERFAAEIKPIFNKIAEIIKERQKAIDTIEPGPG